MKYAFPISMEGRSLRDCLLESVDDLDSITKQILDSLLNRDKHQRGAESLSHLVQLVEGKQKEMRELLQKAPEFREREKLIRRLEECVENRNGIIEKIEGNLKMAETVLSAAVYQASKKLQAVRTAEARPVDSEEVIKLAHQISKNNSVAAPLTWQQGESTRPFPTEPEFRNSALAAPRSAVPPPPMNLLRAHHQAGVMRTSPAMGPGGRGGASPMTGIAGQAKPWGAGSGSPRVGYQQTNVSPRGRGVSAMGYGGVGGRGGSTEVSPFPRRNTQSSPRMASPSVTLTGFAAPRLAQPVNTVEQMSSDSSSSSSSEDEESPNQ